ncbi:MAG: hypothetical protein PHH93_01385, partial [Prolixibacteraceae bacterium]|nr:hypothetical protein [Prolixibacteraceae bacterium]
IAIAGHLNEAVRVKNLLGQIQVRSELAGFIAVDNTDKHELYIGSLHQLNEIVRINRVDEIIFCAENMSSSEIIKAMLDLTTLDIDFKIAPQKSISIIGSNSIHTAGDLYVVHINAISRPENRYRKRVLDIGAAIFLFLLSPFIIWYYKNKRQFIRNITDVVTGRKSWVGYSCKNQTNQNLPSLRPGILSPAGMFNIEEDDYVKREQLDILYARDYQMLTDSEIILKGWKNLDKQ